MLVLIGGEKGGVGKTALTLNLATMRARAGKDVLLSMPISRPVPTSGRVFVAKRRSSRRLRVCKRRERH
jgi:nitrogenase subunit NifH